MGKGKEDQILLRGKQEDRQRQIKSAQHHS